MKRLIVLLCILLSLFAIDAKASEWDELKGDHFIVYYTRSKTYAKNTLEKAEEYYRTIAGELGYVRHSKFWNWDQRVKIYIFPSEKDYLSFIEGKGYAKWSVGFADYSTKEIRSFQKSEGFLDQILPHEITHLMFRDYVGQGRIPIWIDEGVAQWQEEGKREMVKEKIKEELKHHSPISMDRMMSLNVGVINNEYIVKLYYLQAVSLVDFLIDRYGSEKFIHFCRQLRDGRDIDTALQLSYPTAIRSSDELEREWLDYLEMNGE